MSTNCSKHKKTELVEYYICPDCDSIKDREIQLLRSKHLAIISEYEHRRDECTGFAGVLYDLAKDAIRGTK